MKKILFLFLIIACTRREASYISHSEFRNTKVGEDMPIQGGWWIGGKPENEYGRPYLEKEKRYFVLLVDDERYFDYELWCQAGECGELGEKIHKKGGYLLINSSGKFASEIGIKYVHGKQDAKILLIADKNQTVIGIYENAKVSDIEEILKKHNLL